VLLELEVAGLAHFGARVTRPVYRQSPLAVAGTPDILMVSTLVQIELNLPLIGSGCDDARGSPSPPGRIIP